MPKCFDASVGGSLLGTTSLLAPLSALWREGEVLASCCTVRVEAFSVTSLDALRPSARPVRYRLHRRSSPVAGLASWLTPSVADLVFVACLAISMLFGTAMVSADGDAARHIAVGRVMLESRAFLHQDVFSHTMSGQPFVPYEWLAEVAAAAAHELAGVASVALLHGAALSLAFAVLFGHLRSRGAPVLLALAVTMLAVATSILHWLARPHAFTVLGVAIFASVLSRWRQGSLSAKWLLILPALMIPWANTHGGFLVGLILIGLYGTADVMRLLAGDGSAAVPARARLRRLAPVALFTLAATLLNPAGPALLVHVTSYFDKQLLVDRTVEYMSPDFHQSYARPFLFMLLVTPGALAWSRRRPTLEELLLLGTFTAFALYAARNVPLFAIVVAPLLASQLSAIPAAVAVSERLRPVTGWIGSWLQRRNAAYGRIDSQARGHLWPAIAVAGLLGIGAAQHRQGVLPLGVEFSPERLPVAAAAHVKEAQPVGNGFNELGWGGYLLYTLWPGQKVFIDGQTDFYGEALTRDYLAVVELQANWQDVLERYAVRWLVYNTDSPLVRTLVETGNWRVTHEDRLATVLVRDPQSRR